MGPREPKGAAMTQGCQAQACSYPHTPSFLFPLLSKFSAAWTVSTSSAAEASWPSGPQRSPGPSPGGSAALGCAASLVSADLPCTCQGDQVLQTQRFKLPSPHRVLRPAFLKGHIGEKGDGVQKHISLTLSCSELTGRVFKRMLPYSHESLGPVHLAGHTTQSPII